MWEWPKARNVAEYATMREQASLEKAKSLPAERQAQRILGFSQCFYSSENAFYSEGLQSPLLIPHVCPARLHDMVLLPLVDMRCKTNS
jgi:hypothetical protein